MIDNKELERFQQLLTEEFNRLRAKLEPEDEMEESEVSYNMGRGELATEARRQYRDEALGTMDQQKLQQIKEALEAINAGTYGQCANCEKPIAIERLRALPSATLCINCQAEASKNEK